MLNEAFISLYKAVTNDTEEEGEERPRKCSEKFRREQSESRFVILNDYIIGSERMPTRHINWFLPPARCARRVARTTNDQEHAVHLALRKRVLGFFCYLS